MSESLSALRSYATVNEADGPGPDVGRRVARRLPSEAGMEGATLFLIRKVGQEQYWACSSEHGSGWCDRPEQAFARSELTAELRRLIDQGWFCDLMVLELYICGPDR